MEQRLTRDQPAAYRIQVQGHLGQRWADYLGGLTISISGEPDGTVTTLSGQVIDQAALFGILNSLYDLGFPLLCVEYLAQLSPQKGGEGGTTNAKRIVEAGPSCRGTIVNQE